MQHGKLNYAIQQFASLVISPPLPDFKVGDRVKINEKAYSDTLFPIYGQEGTVVEILNKVIDTKNLDIKAVVVLFDNAITWYGETKRQWEISTQYIDKITTGDSIETKCICDIMMLMRAGCSCGHLKKQREKV